MLLLKFSCASWHYKHCHVFGKILKLLIKTVFIYRFFNFFPSTCCIALFLWSSVVTYRICIVIPPPNGGILESQASTSRNALLSYLFYVLSVAVFDTVSIVCKSLTMLFSSFFLYVHVFGEKIINFGLSYIGLCRGKSNRLRI